ncbi:MAG TPA: SRPBCC family protein [Kribbellaceae bacterium]|jgi:hypothetical protein
MSEVRLTGRITIDAPPHEAYRLFTPEGERAWAAGWDPSYPVPAEDDTAPGTVFETGAHGETTTWIVLARDPGRAISYARVTPGARAGTVGVVLSPAAGGRTEATVAYELTALTDAARAQLREFAAGYPAFLASWERAIAATLSG